MILLARHGETDHNVAPARVQGWVDPPLNDRGRGQALVLADAVAGERVVALYASHLRRARETAAIVGERLGLEVALDERLAESRRGEWEGRLVRDIERDARELWSAWLEAGSSFRFPGGESLAEHQQRVAAAIEEIGRGPLPALAVCHGGSIRCAFAHARTGGLEGFHELEVPNATVLRLPVESVASGAR